MLTLSSKNRFTTLTYMLLHMQAHTYIHAGTHASTDTSTYACMRLDVARECVRACLVTHMFVGRQLTRTRGCMIPPMSSRVTLAQRQRGWQWSHGMARIKLHKNCRSTSRCARHARAADGLECVCFMFLECHGGPCRAACLVHIRCGRWSSRSALY